MKPAQKHDVGLVAILAMAAGFGLGTADSTPQWWAWLIRAVLLVTFLRTFFRVTR